MELQINVSNYDGDSLESRIIKEAAHQLVEHVKSALVDETRRRINEQINSRANQEVDRAVDRVIAEGVQKTNSWGEPIGQKLDIRAVFLSKISSRDLNKSIENAIDKMAQNEMKAEMAAIRKEVREKWGEKITKEVVNAIKKHSENLPF